MATHKVIYTAITRDGKELPDNWFYCDAPDFASARRQLLAYPDAKADAALQYGVKESDIDRIRIDKVIETGC